MAKKKIDIHERCDELVAQDPIILHTIVETFKKHLRDSDEVAVAAPMLGRKERIFCLKFANGDIRAFINPMITGKSGVIMSDEHQIGFSPKRFIVPRFKEIDVVYITPAGNVEANTFKDGASSIIQQMIDLLDGIILKDFALEVLDGWDELPIDDKLTIFKMYLESLNKKSEGLQEIIDKDKTLKDIDKELSFMRQYQEGKIETMPLTDEEKQQLQNNSKVHKA